MKSFYKKLILKQFTKFAVVGVINTGLDFAILNFLIWITEIYKGGWLGFLNFFSFSLAALNSYFLNKFWTFQENSKEKTKIQFLQFFLISLTGCLINASIVYFLATFIPPFFGLSQLLWINMAKLLAIAISLCWNFLGYKFWVFQK